jgi:hypothetical protein
MILRTDEQPANNVIDWLLILHLISMNVITII